MLLEAYETSSRVPTSRFLPFEVLCRPIDPYPCIIEEEETHPAARDASFDCTKTTARSNE